MEPLCLPAKPASPYHQRGQFCWNAITLAITLKGLAKTYKTTPVAACSPMEDPHTREDLYRLKTLRLDMAHMLQKSTVIKVSI